MSTQERPLLQAVGVSKRWHAGTASQVIAVDEVTLAIPRGAFVVVSGPSGGGKTTLLSLLGALERPSAGHVLFDGQDLQEASEAERTRIRRRLGFVFQSSPMIRGLAVWENITYPLIPLGVSARTRSERAAALLARVGLASFSNKRPAELSGGELQRVGIARALVGDPQAVLADEPTSNLDQRSGEAIAAMLQEIHASGTTVVIATHDRQFLPMATATYEMKAGRL